MPGPPEPHAQASARQGRAHSAFRAPGRLGAVVLECDLTPLRARELHTRPVFSRYRTERQVIDPSGPDSWVPNLEKVSNSRENHPERTLVTSCHLGHAFVLNGHAINGGFVLFNDLRH